MKLNKKQEKDIIDIIKSGFEMGYSKTHKITEIMYYLFPTVDLIYNDNESIISEKIYNKYVNLI